jgi:hypothetical protein
MARVRVVRLLRRAGYVARHRWERDVAETRRYGRHFVQLHRYDDDAGPVAGQVAVDPWQMARKLAGCGASWWPDLRKRGGELVAVDRPKLCGKNTLCPVCAAMTSARAAGTIRDDIAARLRAGEYVGPLSLVTLTQRADPGETLAEALDRLKSSWRRLRAGRRGMKMKRFIPSLFYGVEVTRSWAGKHEGKPAPPESAQWWHVHMHVVVELAEGEREDTARAWLGRAWQTVTDAERPGWGWDPYAGGVDDDDPTWAGRWWRTIDPHQPREVYQACKYPSPVAEMGPVALAEFCAVSHGRRWHDGAGRWRGLAKLAEELAEADEPARWDWDPEIDTDTPPPPDLGERVCAPGGLCPDSDGEEPWAVWSLPYPTVDAVPADIVSLVEERGGWVELVAPPESFARTRARAGERARAALGLPSPDPGGDGSVSFARPHPCAVLPREWVNESRESMNAALAAWHDRKRAEWD